MAEIEKAVIPLCEVAHRRGANADPVPFGGDKLAVLFFYFMGIGVADGQGDHGLADRVYSD